MNARSLLILRDALFQVLENMWKRRKNSFNNKDRDVLYLDYTVDLGSVTYATKDTLVMRDRQVKAEWFEVTYNN